MSLVETYPATGYFLRGHSPLPGGGRPKGSRNKLAEGMIDDLYHDWMAHGMQAVREVRETRPSDYLKICALLVSKCDDAIFERITHHEDIERIIEERRQKVLARLEKMRE